MKKNRIHAILILLGVFLLLSGLFIWQKLSHRIPDNPVGTVGNTAGNLNNKGLFCESDGKVYFANAYDGYSLYSMNPDETDFKKLASSAAQSINAGGNYLYYYQTNAAEGSSFSFMSRFSGIYRMKKKGGNSNCLTQDLSIILSLSDNHIYYQHFADGIGTTLYKLKTDGSTNEQVTDYMVNPACIVDGTMYFNGTGNDHNLYTLKTASDSVENIWDGNIWNPVADNGYVYYMDVPNNYRLCRYLLSTGEVQVVTEDRIDGFNLYGNYVYYQKNDSEHPAFKRVTIDGQNEEIIKEGNFEKINITSEYVYFNEFNIPVPVYKTSTTGAVSVSTFDTARQAAVDNIKLK